MIARSFHVRPPDCHPEQHEHELAALRLIEHPIVQEAYGRVHDHWLTEMDPSPAMRECFDWAFREVMFSAAIWSSNQDPLRPKVIGHHAPGASSG